MARLFNGISVNGRSYLVQTDVCLHRSVTSNFSAALLCRFCQSVCTLCFDGLAIDFQPLDCLSILSCGFLLVPDWFRTVDWFLMQFKKQRNTNDPVLIAL